MHIGRMLSWTANRDPGRIAVGGPLPPSRTSSRPKLRPGEVTLGVMPLSHTMGVRSQILRRELTEGRSQPLAEVCP
jgi:hypothetical protein